MIAEAQEILEELKREIHRANSPWLNRKNAALYADRSVMTIDKWANEGRIKRYKKTGDPLFKKTEIDACIEGKDK